MENISATLSHGGRFIQYNIFGNIFEVGGMGNTLMLSRRSTTSKKEKLDSKKKPGAEEEIGEEEEEPPPEDVKPVGDVIKSIGKGSGAPVYLAAVLEYLAAEIYG